MEKELLVFAGNSNPALAKEIAAYIGEPLGEILTEKFSDGEIHIKIEENVRGKDVFIVQSTCRPANENVMELLVIIDAAKRASARRITAVMPYYGYARQDRKAEPRVPITARLVADLLTAAGTSRVITLDLHSGQIQGFFNIPVDNLYARYVFSPYLNEHFSEAIKDKKLTIVSPDAGGTERARSYAKRLEATIAVIDKRREEANVSQVMNVIGDVKGRVTIILDDMIDTGGTTIGAGEALRKIGASGVHSLCTHGVFSGSAIKLMEESSIESNAVTNSIPIPKENNYQKIIQLSIAGLIGEAIKRVHKEQSVSDLFK